MLRVPILYGDVTFVEESAVTVLFNKVMATGNSCVMSDYERRYPTLCEDIAHVILKLAEARLKVSSFEKSMRRYL